MLRTTKRERLFYTDFQKMIDTIYEAAKKLEELLENYTNTEVRINEITELEHSCDILCHQAIERINGAFITPIDREDIYLIDKSLDDIMDHIEETAARFSIYNIKVIKPEAVVFAKVITASIVHLQRLIELMPLGKAAKEMQAEIIEVNRLENQGDTIYRQQLTNLFANEQNAVELLAWSSVYESLETALDACEDIASIIEGVLMKHA